MNDDEDNNDITKLNFSAIRAKLYGRSTELSTLREVYNRVSGCSRQEAIDQTDETFAENKCSTTKKLGRDDKRNSDRTFPSTADGRDDSNTSITTDERGASNALLRGDESDLSMKPPAGRNQYKQSPSEMVLVSGYSGTGKSSLVWKFKEDCSNNNCSDGHYFVHGQFDQMQDYHPYSALRTTLDGLCDIVFCSQDSESAEGNSLSEIGLAVKRELGIDALKKLIPIIPKLQQITTSASMDVDVSSSFGSTSILEAKGSFLFTLRQFIQAVCSKCCIVVWFLDDLHRADMESVNLIKSLLMDKRTTNILFLGCHSEGEDDDACDCNGEELTERRVDRILTGSLYNLGECGVTVTEIRLGNFDQESTNALISEVLRRDGKETISLSKAVHSKTLGNVSSILQFLEALQTEGLLWFCLQSFKWTWAEVNEIQSNTTSSQNVADFMVKKIKRIQEDTKAALMIASGLGCHFDMELFGYILESLRTCVHAKQCAQEIPTLKSLTEKTDASNLICTAIEEGILEKVTGVGYSTVYKFSHDHVLQYCYSLLPSGKELEIFHLRMAELMYKRLNSMSENRRREKIWELFVTVNQFNLGSKQLTDTSRKLEVAKLNFRVAKITAASSAFVPTSKYLRKSIGLLEGLNPWMEHYDLFLEVCNLSLAMEQCIGNVDYCTNMVKEILKNAKALEDKIHAHLVRLELLSSKGESLDDILNEGLNIFSILGETFPSRFWRYNLLKERLKTKMMLRNMTDSGVIALPILTNKKKIAAMEVLGHLFCWGGMKYSPKFLPLVVFRLVQYSITHGLCSASPPAFAMYGAFLCGPFRDIKNGIRYGNIAISLTKRVDKKWHAFTMFFVQTFIFPWTEHIQKTLDPLLNSYESGMRSGEVLGATICAYSYCEKYVITGMPLVPIEKDMRLYHQLMIEYDQATPDHMLAPVWQFVLNLIGQSEDPLELVGDAMDQRSYIKHAKQNKNVWWTERAYVAQFELAYIFDEIDFAANLLATVLENAKTSLISPYFVRFRCLCGLVALSMTRKTGKRKWKKLSKSAMKQVRRWVKTNGGNILHHYLLMKAEQDSLSEDKEIVKESFDLAIATAGRNGFVHDRAIANERAGIYFLESGDEFWASFYLSRAYELYHDWGAKAKVGSMRRKHASLLRTIEEHEKILGHRGKSRFIDASKRHKNIKFQSIWHYQSPSRETGLR